MTMVKQEEETCFQKPKNEKTYFKPPKTERDAKFEELSKALIRDLISHYKEAQASAAGNNSFITPKLTLIEHFTSDNFNFETYASALYAYSLSLDYKLPVNILNRHSISRDIRTRLIDWMIQIFDLYNSEPNTLFLAVHLMDMYVTKTTFHWDEDDFLLVGWTSIFIASKMEDILPLHMKHIKTKFGQDKFSEMEIWICEKAILETLNFDLVVTNTYEFIRTYLYDFCTTYKDKIVRWGMNVYIKNLENLSVFWAKFLMWNEYFNKYNHSLKGICCIILAYDIIKGYYGRSFLVKMDELAKNWVNYWINQSAFSKHQINQCYKKLADYYKTIDSVYKKAPTLKSIKLMFC